MICLICRQAELVHRLTSVTLERAELKLVVNSVPARVCPNCGEAYVDEKAAVRLLRHAEQTALLGTRMEVCEYGSL
jgi:YgiT-type zinc finger domain-containing protein